jgi:predicted metal-binding membrane protein
MHACWILLCMLLKSFLLCILKFLKVSVSERSPRASLKVALPNLWVAGYVTVWYQSFWLKHRAGMGPVCWSESRGQDRISTVELKISGGMALQNICGR